MNPMIIYIDPASDVHYSSFYIKGLLDVFGKKKIKYSSKYFKSFKHNNHFFAFVIINDNSIKKIIIDFTDGEVINNEAYVWSDVYAKININENNDNHKLEKLISIGPSFGINIFSPIETVYFSITNFIKGYSRIPNKKKFFSDYKAQLKRPKIEEYTPNHNEKKLYIYFVSSLWKKEIKTNNFRANFIKAVRNNKYFIFEGGFAPRTKNDIVGFEDLTMNKRDSMSNYLLKTKKSWLVFNTPAVLDCHGWKLAEFLSLGKTIISTEISRKLPSQLLNNKHIVLTTGTEEDIKNKIEFLLENKTLTTKLEKNSREYYENFLAPTKVIELILKN